MTSETAFVQSDLRFLIPLQPGQQVAIVGDAPELAAALADEKITAVLISPAGKSVAVGKPDGLVKIMFNPDTKELLGAHIVGAEATELIHELLLAKTTELLPDDIATMIHAHPTLSETLMEVMRAVEGWVIHA